ncbi:hypothetical protein FHW68_000427 [Pseudomonas sp. Tn43]|nr:hypothetical protein [Pseudomonas sp. Tn43]
MQDNHEVHLQHEVVDYIYASRTRLIVSIQLFIDSSVLISFRFALKYVMKSCP